MCVWSLDAISTRVCSHTHEGGGSSIFFSDSRRVSFFAGNGTAAAVVLLLLASLYIWVCVCVLSRLICVCIRSHCYAAVSVYTRRERLMDSKSGCKVTSLIYTALWRGMDGCVRVCVRERALITDFDQAAACAVYIYLGIEM